MGERAGSASSVGETPTAATETVTETVALPKKSPRIRDCRKTDTLLLMWISQVG
jgi:hypothetical protein